MYDLTTTVKLGHEEVHLSEGIIEDLEAWTLFLKHYNGITIFREKIKCTSDDIHLYSDASKRGYGAVYGANYIVGLFPEPWQSLTITILELSLIHI